MWQKIVREVKYIESGVQSLWLRKAIQIVPINQNVATVVHWTMMLLITATAQRTKIFHKLKRNTIMNLLLWNCNGLRIKTHFLASLVRIHEPLLIVPTETHLNKMVHDSEFNMHNFENFRRDRLTKGGVV